MAYKIIDDETALTIFEAIQENSTRSFTRYNCLRQLPKHKINGELLFYLDELLDFAQKELKQDPSETLEQVVDFGLTAWFGNLAPEFQRKAGFSIKSTDADQAAADDEHPSESKEMLKLLTKKNKAIASLEEENQRLQDSIETSAAEKIMLKREIAHLEQVNEELAEQSPQMPGYLCDSGVQSGYMALTTHSLSTPQAAGKDPAQPATPKKKKRRKKKGGGGTPPSSSPQGAGTQ